MGREFEGVETYFAVGLVAYLHPLSVGGESSRYKTVIRGWQKGSYILLETPAGEEKLPIFTEERMCTMRFLHEGRACGFGTRVLDSGAGGALGYARITWPRHIETVRVRKQERLHATIPCELTFLTGEKSDGIITDLSAGGCCLRCESQTLAKENENVLLHFTLPDGTLIRGVCALVRNVRPGPTGPVLGCEFNGEDDLLRQDVSFYVTSTLERMRGLPAAGRRLLIVGRGESDRRTLNRIFRSMEFEVLAADGLVDAFYRLRMSNPVAVFIGSDCCEISADRVCRIIKGTRGYEGTPVFLYGGSSDELRHRAEEAGAHDYFPTVGKVAAIRSALERALALPPDS